MLTNPLSGYPSYHTVEVILLEQIQFQKECFCTCDTRMVEESRTSNLCSTTQITTKRFSCLLCQTVTQITLFVKTWESGNMSSLVNYYWLKFILLTYLTYLFYLVSTTINSVIQLFQNRLRKNVDS